MTCCSVRKKCRFNGWQVAGLERSRQILKELNRRSDESMPDTRADAVLVTVSGFLELDVAA